MRPVRKGSERSASTRLIRSSGRARRPWSAPKRRWSNQHRSAAAVAALVLVLTTTWPGLRPPAAAAAEPTAYVTVTLGQISPALPDRTGDIVLRGVVRNVSDLTLTNLQVIPWRSFAPLRSTDALERAVTSATDEPLGYRVFRVFQNIPSTQNRSLAPGESAPFRIKMPVASFGFPAVDAVYLMGVHVRGRLTAVGPDETLGRSRTLLPVTGTSDDDVPVRLTPLVVLSSRPSLLRPGLFTDAHLAGEIDEDGRLRQLLDAAARPGHSFAVDPLLIQELRDMTSGYDVRTDDQTTVPGTGQADAAEWLADFEALRQSDADGYRLLYGSPDVTALVHDRQRAILRESEEAARAVTGVGQLPLLVMPAGGRTDAMGAEAMADLRPAALVLSRTTTRDPQPFLSGPSGVPVINQTLSVSTAGPGPEPDNTAIQVRQRVLAETWLSSRANPEVAEVRQVAVVDSSLEANVVGAVLRSAPWVRAAPLAGLLDTPPAPWSGQYHYPPSVRARELGAAQLSGVRRLRTTQTTFLQLLVDPADYRRQSRGAAATAASRYWRSRAKAHRTFLEPQQRTVEEMLADVSVVVTPKVVTSARRGLFPVTVRNQLPARDGDPSYNAINAKLVFTSANGQRLSVAPIEALDVRAQESFTSSAQVEARSNGTVRVVAQLYTPEGRAVGRAMPIDVNATQAGTIGWLIAIGAGAVLIGTTTWRIRQVARERAQKEGAAGPRPLEVSRPVERSDV